MQVLDKGTHLAHRTLGKCVGHPQDRDVVEPASLQPRHLPLGALLEQVLDLGALQQPPQALRTAEWAGCDQASVLGRASAIRPLPSRAVR